MNRATLLDIGIQINETSQMIVVVDDDDEEVFQFQFTKIKNCQVAKLTKGF